MSYRQLTAPIPAMLCVGGVTHDVLVVRERRGRVEIQLPDGAPAIALPSAQNWKYLRPGKTMSVPVSMIEMTERRDG